MKADELIHILARGSKKEKDALYAGLLKKYNSEFGSKDALEIEDLMDWLYSARSWRSLINIGDLYAVNVLLMSVSHKFQFDSGPEVLLQKMMMHAEHYYTPMFFKLAHNMLKLLKDKSYLKMFDDRQYSSFGDMLFQLARYNLVRDMLKDRLKDFNGQEKEVLANIIKKAEEKPLIMLRELKGAAGKGSKRIPLTKISYKDFDLEKNV